MDQTCRMPCQMMLHAFTAREHPCCAPSVGGNGLYRYCERHMRMVADAGATTLVWDAATALGRQVQVLADEQERQWLGEIAR
jgi:hypothetical protein